MGGNLDGVLLVAPRMKSMIGGGTDKPYHPHLGLSCLIAYFRDRGIAASGYDVGIEGGFDQLWKVAETQNPAMIGLTSFSYSYAYLIEAIREIRANTKTPIVVGGPHVTATRSEILKSTGVEFAVKGEGEETFEALYLAVASGKQSYEDIPGLLWRRDGEIVENGDRPLIRDVGSLPIPALDAFGIENYECHKFKSVPLMTERGCPYPCNFCAVRKTGYRVQMPVRVIDEMEYWYRKGYDQFDINDDAFNVDRERVSEICDLIVRRGLRIKYQLYNGIRADRVTPEILQKLKDSGCTFITYGVESGNPEILKRIEKRLTLEQVRKACEWTRDAGIPFSVNFIVGHPGETYESAMDSVRFAETLPAKFINFYNLVPYPGTSLFEWVKRNGRFLVREESYLMDISYRDNEPIFETDEFTAEDRRRVVKQGFEIYNRSLLTFRLGGGLGRAGSFLMRWAPLARFGRHVVVNTRLGRWCFVRLSARSRETGS